jgi:hypothetical protein
VKKQKILNTLNKLKKIHTHLLIVLDDDDDDDDDKAGRPTMIGLVSIVLHSS